MIILRKIEFNELIHSELKLAFRVLVKMYVNGNHTVEIFMFHRKRFPPMSKIKNLVKTATQQIDKQRIKKCIGIIRTSNQKILKHIDINRLEFF